MPELRRFVQVDVFTATPLQGNPLAVVVDAAGLSAEEMASFARWTNLSETTFLLPPTDPAADYRVRIFTPGGELPFAGHPTLGSCEAWLLAGGQPKQPGEVVQQCGVGLVRVRRAGRRLAFAAPPCRMGEVEAPLLASVLPSATTPASITVTTMPAPHAGGTPQRASRSTGPLSTNIRATATAMKARLLRALSGSDHSSGPVRSQ